MDILQQFLLVVFLIIGALLFVLALLKGSNDDDFDDMAQVYCASKDRDGRRLAALGKSQELATVADHHR